MSSDGADFGGLGRRKAWPRLARCGRLLHRMRFAIGPAIFGTAMTGRFRSTPTQLAGMINPFAATADALLELMLKTSGRDSDDSQTDDVTAVTADGSVVIAHWGRYEVVEKATFMRWWSAHTIWSYSGIFGGG